MKTILIFFLVFLLGVIYGQMLTLNTELEHIKSKEHKEYTKKIQDWVTPIVIPEFKVDDWGNRYNK